MKRLLDLIRATVISLETFFVFVGIITFIKWSQWYAMIGNQLSNDGESSKYMFALPPAILIYALSLSNDVLKPDGKLKERFMEWKEYYRIKDRVLISLFVCLICAISSVAGWLFCKTISKPMLGFILIASITESLVVVICLLLAKFSIQQFVNNNFKL
jgi:hypothetical protein